jgi:hypothetical protein
MAINTINGRTVFDPSKRIKAALGEEYAENVKQEAIERLSQAMASNGIRKRDEYIEENAEENNDMRLRDILRKNTTHTNPSQQTIEAMASTNPDEILKIRQNTVVESQNALNAMIYNNSNVNKVIKSVTGFGTDCNKSENARQLINSSLRNISAWVVNDAMETTFRLNNSKYIGISTVIGASVDFCANAGWAGNTTRVKNLFDPKCITQAELNDINKTISKEKIKYGLEHAAASVVIPSAVKFGLNKIVGKKFENNKIFNVATSFGLLSEIGKVSLNLIRRSTEKKAIQNAASKSYNISSEYDVPVKAYSDVAKIAINHTINECMDDTLIASTFGSIVGFNSVVIETPKMSTTSKAIEAFKAKDNIPTIVEPVTVATPKPTTTSSKTTTTTAKSAAKKSA